ncbi:ABC transporter permease [Pseudarthrobacter sp. lyk4-40-TYG-27]|uniref:ABC transporter permease n=1 Tax=Pseudarthrobacter sp. lyk4-40-TYG-27 TaxID=3040305 RepID=UPI0025525BD7|nr:ABC transporter permease [Pseudarthrobacter sp. lyk4-40-TYG-27]
MVVFLIRRLLAGILLVVLVASATYIMLNFTGSDVARNIVGETATPEQAIAKAAELGLDRPLGVRYLEWVGTTFHGDLGKSWFNNVPVSTTLLTALPVTLSIILGALILSAMVSVVLGSIAAVRAGWLDKSIQIGAVLADSIPGFLVALILAMVVAVNFGWLPATGYVTFQRSVVEWLRSITLPSIALAFGATAATTQQLRGSMLDVLSLDFVRTLRSRGLSNRRVIYKHVLRNAAPPALTVLSLQFIGLVGGAVIVEKVFGLRGIGSIATSAAVQGDAPVVLGVVIVMVVIVVTVNLIADLAYGWLNPKVRAE